MTAESSPSEVVLEQGMLELDSSSDEEDMDAAAMLNDLALHSVQHRARLIQPTQAASQPSSPKVQSAGHFRMNSDMDIHTMKIKAENAFFARFETADVGME